MAEVDHEIIFTLTLIIAAVEVILGSMYWVGRISYAVKYAKKLAKGRVETSIGFFLQVGLLLD